MEVFSVKTNPSQRLCVLCYTVLRAARPFASSNTTTHYALKGLCQILGGPYQVALLLLKHFIKAFIKAFFLCFISLTDVVLCIDGGFKC